MDQETLEGAPAGKQERAFPIYTQRKYAPWVWVVAIQLPWFFLNYIEQISGTALTFTLKKFVDAPLIITAIGSFNLIFNVLVGASTNYASDRVWTRLGRRRPFLIFSYVVIFVFLLFIPTIKSFAALIVVVFFYELLRDTGSPTEPLANEVVPPPQRGRAMAICQVIRTGGILFFYSYMIGKWDNTYTFGNWTVTGEMLIYWTGAVLAVVMAAFYLGAVREVRPPDFVPAGREAFRARAALEFLKDVFGPRKHRLLFGVGLAQMIFWTGLGSLAPLLTTEQWGYSKETMGNISAINTVLTMVLVLPLAGYLADRMNRKKVFVAGAVLMTLSHAVFYIYARHFAPGGVPPVAALVGFGFVSSAIGNLATMASVAMMFDYVPTSRLGTVSAGLGITRGLASVLVNNGVALWVTGYSWFFLPAGKYDYLSGYQYLFLLGIAATWMSIWFARADARGELSKDGLQEQAQRQ